MCLSGLAHTQYKWVRTVLWSTWVNQDMDARCCPSTLAELAQLATVCDDNLLRCLPTFRAERFYFLHDIHALFDMAEDDMLTIQPVGREEPGEEVPSTLASRQSYFPKVLILKGTDTPSPKAQSRSVSSPTALQGIPGSRDKFCHPGLFPGSLI